MLHNILIVARILLLVIIAVVLIQIYRYWRRLPKDEVIGDERAKYIITRATVLTVCFVLEAALQIASVALRFLF